MKTNMEMCIMACLFIQPELMENVFVEDKHFTKHKRMWKFMRTFYEKFKTFDINVMYSVCKDKWHIMNYIEELMYVDAYPCYFKQYQERLIEIYNDTEKEKFIREKVYDDATELLLCKITSEEFKSRVEKVYIDANKIYREK